MLPERAPVFDPDRLIPDNPFPRRLQALLDEVRARLGLASIAVVELDAADGRTGPRWRGVSPPQPGPAPDLDVFDAWVAAPPTLPDASVLGLDPAEHGLVLLPLSVQPPLARRADAVVLLAYPGPRPDPGALRSLQVALERGLTADRHERLARVVYSAVVQAADPMEMTDRYARLLWANPAWERFFRYSVRDAVGRTVGALFRDPIKPVHDRAFYQFTLSRLVEGAPWLGTLACRTGDDSRVYTEVHVAPFDATIDGIRGNFAVRRDIAHRVERDEALIIAHSEFRSVLAAIPEGVAVLHDGRIYFANAAFLAMVQRDEESVIGMPYVSFVHPDDELSLDDVPATLSRVRVVTSAGTNRIAEISVAGSVSFEGRPSMIVLSRDTTDYHLAQEQLARAERMTALGSLAAGIAHEINNPLAYVILNLELLRERTRFDEQPSESLSEAVDGAKRIQRIVTELRGFSGSHQPGPPEPVSVVNAVTSAVNIAQNEIRHRARMEREHEGPLFVMAREGELVQVLVNLLVNAAQAIPEGSSGQHVIGVRASTGADGRVLIAVSDTGTGIPREILPHLFDPFVTGKRRGEGSGLGLTITKRIVDGFGGEVRVETAPGLGTTVTVDLPAAQIPSTPAPPDVRTAAPPVRRDRSGRSARVLLVDDEVPIVRALRRVLAAYDVVALHDGHTALEVLTEADAWFDIILCDLMMPGMPGSDLYHRIRAVRPDLAGRFVFMTGGAFTRHGHAFLEGVGARVLQKPFDPRQVVALVEEVASRLPTSRGRGESR
jgi:PAS domain S-box-containing protein